MDDSLGVRLVGYVRGADLAEHPASVLEIVTSRLVSELQDQHLERFGSWKEVEVQILLTPKKAPVSDPLEETQDLPAPNKNMSDTDRLGRAHDDDPTD